VDVLGEGAINAIKDAEEGTPALHIKAWGFELDLREGKFKCGIPMPKVKKLVDMLSESFLNNVSLRRVKMKDHESIQGLVVWMSEASQPLKAPLASLFVMEVSHSEHDVVPKGSEEEVTRKWNEYALALELLKVICLDVQHSPEMFNLEMMSVFSPSEQIMLGVKRGYVGSDATGGSQATISAFDYSTSEWDAMEVNEELDRLKGGMGREHSEARVAWAELLPVVALACKNGHKWTNKIIIAMVDNVEAVATINKRAPRDAVMRYWQGILVRCEVKYKFQMVSRYIATGNNSLPDKSTRWKEREGRLDDFVLEVLPGAVRISMKKEVELLVGSMKRHDEGQVVNSFALLNESVNSAAYKLAQQRCKVQREADMMGALVEPTSPKVYAVIVLNAGVGQFATAAEELGMMCVGLVEPYDEARRACKSRWGEKVHSSVREMDVVGQVDLVVVDSFYENVITFERVLEEVKVAASVYEPAQVVWCMRQSVVGDAEVLRRVDALLADRGYRRVTQSGEEDNEVEVADAVEIKGIVQCRRVVLHYEKGRGAYQLTRLPRCVGPQRTLRDAMVAPEIVPKQCWLPLKLKKGPAKSLLEGRPPLAGFVKNQGRSHPVQRVDAMGASPRPWNQDIAGVGGVLVYDGRNEDLAGVRRLTLYEVAVLQGVSNEVMNSLTDKSAQFCVGGAVSLDVARSIMSRCCLRLQEMGEGEEVSTTGEVTRDRRKCRGGPSNVGKTNYLSELGWNGSLKMVVSNLVGRSIADTSSKTYGSAFSHWSLWRFVRKRPVFLSDGEDWEEEMMLFAAHKGVVLGYAWASIHVMLYAVRFEHLKARRGDPLEGKVVLRMVMKGIKRVQGGQVRKIPVTVDMLREVMKAADLSEWNELVTVTAIVFMFLFLLRSREALRKDGIDEKQCLRTCMLVFYCSGEEVTGDDIMRADEVVWMSAYSKTDPNGQGGVANIFEAPGSELCVVSLLKRMHKMRPGHFSRDGHVFVMSGGKVLHRDEVVGKLKAAAVKQGIPVQAVSVISLRAGGASALFNAGYSVDEIKQRGRWSSDCWRVYVWEGRDRSKEMAQRMLGSSVSVMASLAYYRRHA
jgi:hypothetical protein